MKLRTPLLPALVALLAATTTGCRSHEASESNGHREEHEAADVEFPCICGTPRAAMESCLHPACVQGQTNPANPDCACGTLSFGKE